MTQGTNGPDGLSSELPPEQEARMFAALRSLGEPRAGEIDDATMLARVLGAANDVAVVPLPEGSRSFDREAAAPAVKPRARPTFRRGVAMAFAGLAIAATVAYAAQQYVRSLPPEAPPVPTEGPAPSGAPSVRSVAPRPAPAPSETPSATEEAPPAPSTSAAPEEPAPTVSAPPAPPPTADDLLKRAQKLYTAGDMAGATAAYRALVARYPGSGEARAALISLGQLALAGGRAGEALSDFDRYLASGGPLSTEARVGRIGALRALGRTSEERAAIEDFLARSGSSVHATTAPREARRDRGTLNFFTRRSRAGNRHFAPPSARRRRRLFFDPSSSNDRTLPRHKELHDHDGAYLDARRGDGAHGSRARDGERLRRLGDGEQRRRRQR